MTTNSDRNERDRHRIDRRSVLRTVGTAGVASLAGCLGEGSDGTETGGGADEEVEGGADEEAESGDGDEAGGDDDEGSVGTAEISFLGETYSFDDASCEGHRTFPPENEMIRHRDASEGLEFWVERFDPAESDAVDVHLGFPTGDADETIGEIESYEGRTTIDEIEFELGTGTSGSLRLEPSTDMNDDVDHDPDGGDVEWEIACPN